MFPAAFALPTRTALAFILIFPLCALAQGRPGLMELYADALANNSGFQARLAEFRIAAQREPQATGKLLPQVGLRGSYEYVDEDVNGNFYGLVDIQNKDSFDSGVVGAQLTQALYRPELWIERDQAKLRLTQARFALDEAEDLLLIGVASAYFGVLAAEDHIRLTKAERDAVGRQLDQVEGRFLAGLATEADYQSAVAQQALVEARQLEAKVLREQAYASLQVAAGSEVLAVRRFSKAVVLATPEPARVDAWVERAREQNQSVVGLRLGRKLADGDLKKARKLRWPNVDLTARGLFLDSGGGLTGEREELESRVGINLTVPIYSGGQIGATIKQAKFGRQRAQALLAQAQAEAARDARVSFLDCEVGIQRIPALKAALEAARAAEQSTQAGFEVGTKTTADALRAVERRYAAERDYAGARYKFMLDTLRLKHAAGNLANTDLAQFDRLLERQ